MRKPRLTLDLAVVVDPGDAEDDGALGLDQALEQAVSGVFGMFFNVGPQALHHFGHGLQVLALAGVALGHVAQERVEGLEFHQPSFTKMLHGVMRKKHFAGRCAPFWCGYHVCRVRCPKGRRTGQRPRRNRLSSSRIADLAPGRPAVVALVGALGGFHLAQQRVHLVERELAVGAHRAVAGHGGQQLVLRALDHGAGVVLRQFGQHAARQFHRVALGQRWWARRARPGSWARTA